MTSINENESQSDTFIKEQEENGFKTPLKSIAKQSHMRTAFGNLSNTNHTKRILGDDLFLTKRRRSQRSQLAGSNFLSRKRINKSTKIVNKKSSVKRRRIENNSDENERQLKNDEDLEIKKYISHLDNVQHRLKEDYSVYVTSDGTRITYSISDPICGILGNSSDFEEVMSDLGIALNDDDDEYNTDEFTSICPYAARLSTVIQRRKFRPTLEVIPELATTIKTAKSDVEKLENDFPTIREKSPSISDLTLPSPI